MTFQPVDIYHSSAEKRLLLVAASLTLKNMLTHTVQFTYIPSFPYFSFTFSFSNLTVPPFIEVDWQYILIKAMQTASLNPTIPRCVYVLWSPTHSHIDSDRWHYAPHAHTYAETFHADAADDLDWFLW